jgi:hypothetical protein
VPKNIDKIKKDDSFMLNEELTNYIVIDQGIRSMLEGDGDGARVVLSTGEYVRQNK